MYTVFMVLVRFNDEDILRIRNKLVAFDYCNFSQNYISIDEKLVIKLIQMKEIWMKSISLLVINLNVWHNMAMYSISLNKLFDFRLLCRHKRKKIIENSSWQHTHWNSMLEWTTTTSKSNESEFTIHVLFSYIRVSKCIYLHV